MMRRALLLALAALLALPPAALARPEGKVLCGGFHLVRFIPNGTQEIFLTSWSVRNANLSDPVTIERLTVRNAFGTVVWESGPATAIPHPLNTDFVPPLDITTVPPGGSFYLTSSHIWGLGNIPAGPVGQGNSLSATVEFSTTGKAREVFVSAQPRIRELLPGLGQGFEHSRVTASCIEVK